MELMHVQLPEGPDNLTRVTVCEVGAKLFFP